MTTRKLLLVAALALAPGGLLAEGFAKATRPSAVVTVSCADLTAEAQARHPQCQPRQLARQTPAVRPFFLAGFRSEAPRRKMVAMPWMIGVYQ